MKKEIKALKNDNNEKRREIEKLKNEMHYRLVAIEERVIKRKKSDENKDFEKMSIYEKHTSERYRDTLPYNEKWNHDI